MKALQLYFVLCVTLMMTMHSISAQTNTNEIVIKKIYEAIQNNDAPNLITELMPDLKFYDSDNSFVEYDQYMNNTSRDSELELFNYNWINLKFQDLIIQNIEKDIVLATGTISGISIERDKTKTQKFYHLWWLKNGRVTKFLQ